MQLRVLDQTHGSNPLCWSLTPLTCFQLSVACWRIKHTSTHGFPDGLVDKRRSVVCSVCWISLLLIHQVLPWSPQCSDWDLEECCCCAVRRHACLQRGGSTSSGSRRFLGTTRRVEWTSFKTRRCRRTSKYERDVAFVITVSHRWSSSNNAAAWVAEERRPHFFCVSLPPYLQCADICVKSSEIFFIPHLSKTHAEADDSWDVPNNSSSQRL